MRKKLPLAYKLMMKKILTIFFISIALVAQAQVIPVGFLKKKVLVSTPIPENLLLYLDATKTDSYGGTGTTWTDLSGMSPSNNATLYGSPTFESGSFTFAVDKYAYIANQVNFSSGTGTFIAWINPSKIHTIYTGIIFSRSGLATGLNLFASNNSVGYHWNDIGGSYEWNSNLQVPINRWSMIAVSISTSSVTAYLCNSNGTTSATNTVSHAQTLGHKFYIARDPGAASQRTFIGKIGTAMVYSTALTSANITTIFNAQKSAFGL
jgi:hypothetical protein